VIENEWLETDDPQGMVEYLCGRVSDRRMLLLASACCRLIWDKLTD
jgi:hypothetical protein